MIEVGKKVKMDQIDRVRGLDVVRAIAILSVIFYHLVICVSELPKPIYKMFISGWSGVDLFFVLSGYLIAAQSLKIGKSQSPWMDTKVFWIKRWFRTFPLYFFLLFIYVFIKPVLFKAEFKGDPLYYLFFLQNYFSPKDYVQSWSLCIEEQFYIVFPLLFYLLPIRKIRGWYWLLPILLSIGLRYHVLDAQGDLPDHLYSYLIRFRTHMHLDGICLGVFLAWMEPYWIDKVQNKSKSLFVIGLFLFLVFSFLSGHSPKGAMGYLSYTLLSISGAMMVMGSIHLKVNDKLYRFMYFISVTSYGAYLWNNVVMRIMTRYFDKQYHWGLSSLVYFILSFLLAYITYRLIEEPFMKLRKSVLKRVTR